MTLTHAVLVKAGALLAIPVVIFLIAFLVAAVDFIYARLATKPAKIGEIPSFLRNSR
jgi:hypothetical protein